MSQLNNIPTFQIPLNVGNNISKDWYFFWVGLYTGIPPALPAPIIVGASPFTYGAPVKGTVIVSGGAASNIEFSRDGITFYTTGETVGMFTLNAADRLRVTHAGAPSMTFVPT